MEKIEDKNFLIQVQNANCLKLYEELEGLVVSYFIKYYFSFTFLTILLFLL